MSGKKRVPTIITLFNSYIVATDNFLQADDPGNPGHKQWERLGLSSAQAAAWHTSRGNWDSIYLLHSDPNTRTKSVNDDVKAAIKDFIKDSRKPLNTIANSDNAKNSDAELFKVVLTGNRKDPTHRNLPITEECIVGIKALGSARYRISLRKSTDTKRPSLPEGVDAAQAAVQLGGTQPESADDLTETYILTRASSVHSFGTQNIGKKLFLFVRWYYTKNPDFAGSWSAITIILIS